MSENENTGPVDNSHRDASIAARDSRQESEAKAVVEAVEEVAEKAAESVVDQAEDEGDEQEAQNDTEESAASDDDQHDKPKRKGVGKRIDELTKEKHDARRAAEDAARERDYWRELAQKAQQKPDEAPAQEASNETGEPTLEGSDYDLVEFQRKHYQWMREQERKQEQATQRQARFLEKQAAFVAEHPDYHTVVTAPHVPITQQVAEIVMETDNPPAVAYYLAQNLSEATAIAQMTPHNAARAIGRIEAKLEAPAAPEVPRQPAPKTVTKAPAPLTTLSGSPAVKKSYDDMSMREYDAARRKERAAKGLID